MNKHLLIHRICKLLHIRHYYENQYGLKEHNKPQFVKRKDYPITEIDPKKVKLGFDALKDEFTLCRKPLLESPHYDLMHRLSLDEDISKSDYIIRESKGFLDGRYELKPTNHMKEYTDSKESIIAGEYEPAIIYSIDGEYFAYDGKHRLALCCLLGINCKCTIIDLEELCQDQHTKNIFRLMKKKKDYSINLSLLGKIFDEEYY